MLSAEHQVSGSFSGPLSVFAGDVDGDGDYDVLGTSFGTDDIAWWENLNGLGTSWTERTVDGSFGHPLSVRLVDIDADGYMDVLCAACMDDDVAWWENSDTSPGIYWTKHTVSGNFDGARSVFAEDIDGDGDMDVLGAACSGNDITWWENLNGSGDSWLEHPVDVEFYGAWSVSSGDFDGDGDMDLLGAARYGTGDVAWWENTDGSGGSWIEHTIRLSFSGVWSVCPIDMDGDGDLDVLGAADTGPNILWWENADGSGISWTEHTVDGSFSGARWVCTGDMDCDGDPDVLGARGTPGNEVAWWENLDGTGTSWTEHTVAGEFEGAYSVCCGDIDGDGREDVLAAANVSNRVAWWDLTPTGWLESSIIDTQTGPDWGDLSFSTDIPAGTSVSFQIRASDDWQSMGDWSGPITEPSSLDGILVDGDRYAQYRIVLESSDPLVEPAVDHVIVSWDPTGIEGGGGTESPELLPFLPNPSSAPEARFFLPESGTVEIQVYSLCGRMVVGQEIDSCSPGEQSLSLGTLPSGVYVCRMVVGGLTDSKSFVVIQ